MLGVPQHSVAGVQPDRCAGGLSQLDRCVDVVVVPVRTHDGSDPTAADRVEYRRRVMGGVDHDHIGVVADQPDVVVDGPGPAVEPKLARRDDPVDPYAAGHHTTTERSTWPCC